jgi:hypothetical protein
MRLDEACGELRQQLLGAQTIDLDRYVAVKAHEDPLATPGCVLLLHLKPNPIRQRDWPEDRFERIHREAGIEEIR